MANGLAQTMQDTRDAAEHWFVRLRADGCGVQERAAFERWLAADASHAKAYREVERVWQASVDLLQDPALAAARAEAHRRPAQLRAPVRRWRALAWAAAAVLVLGVGLGAYLRYEVPVPIVSHATPVGEQRSLRLADGTEVRLDTDTAIDVRYGGRERRISLTRGRAEFSVARDPGKPFIVDTVEGSVRALGTRFQIRIEGRDAGGVRDGAAGRDGPGRATVLLLEGSVAVTAAAHRAGTPRTETLKPGEALVFAADGREWRKHASDLDFAEGWTQGDLIFNERPLSELLAEANRYTATQLRLADPALGDIRISGVFHANDQDAMLLSLQHGWGLQAIRVSDQETVLSRR